MLEITFSSEVKLLISKEGIGSLFDKFFSGFVYSDSWKLFIFKDWIFSSLVVFVKVFKSLEISVLLELRKLLISNSFVCKAEVASIILLFSNW